MAGKEDSISVPFQLTTTALVRRVISGASAVTNCATMIAPNPNPNPIPVTSNYCKNYSLKAIQSNAFTTSDLRFTGR